MAELNGATEPVATPAPQAPPVDSKIDYNDDDRDASFRDEAYEVFDKVMARSNDTDADKPEADARPNNADSSTAGPERDERGRFKSTKSEDEDAAKADDGAEEDDETQAAKSDDTTEDEAKEKPDDGPLSLPGTLPKSFAENWNKMPREAQEVFSAREKQMQEKASQMGRQIKEAQDDLKLLDPVTQVISKHAETFRQANVHPANVLELMMHRHQGLRENPVQMISQLANDYKFDRNDVFDRLVVGSDPTAAIARIAGKFNLDLLDIALGDVQPNSGQQPPNQQASQPASQPAPQTNAAESARVRQLEAQIAELQQNRSPASDEGPSEEEVALAQSVQAFSEQHDDFEALADLIAPTLPGLRDEYPLLEPIQILEIAYDRIKDRYVPAGSVQQSADTTGDRLARANAVNVNGSGRRGSSKASLSEHDEIDGAWRKIMG